ncbi:MAG: PAS domain-containing protein [Campylobacteraceae bacterium]|nr:PAS domain-containing protein [Campylobacteraceae bacterium]
MQRPAPLNEEIKLDPEKMIVSKTDTDGYITYVNEYFEEICGYSKDELLGSSHNIIRHPDMPRIIFKLMWQNIKEQKDFKVLIKNLAKDGRYYWVLTKFETLIDPITQKIISHTAYRKAPTRYQIGVIEPLYEKMIEIEKYGGVAASEKFLDEFLRENGMSYEEFIKSTATHEKKGFMDKTKGFLKGIIKK